MCTVLSGCISHTVYLCISVFVYFYTCDFFLVKLYKCAFTVLCGCNSHNARGRNILVLFPPSSPLTLQAFTRSVVWYFKTFKEFDTQGSTWPYWSLDPFVQVDQTLDPLRCSYGVITVDLHTRLFSLLKEQLLLTIPTRP